MNCGFEITDARVFPPLSAENDCSLFGHTGETEFIQTLKAAGVTRCAGPVMLKKNGSWAEIHALNTAAFAFSVRSGNYYIPAVQIHPEFPEESLAEVRTLHGKYGLRLIEGCAAHTPVWEFAAEEGIAVSLSVALGETDLEFPRQLLEKFPELKLILCGPGDNKNSYNARLTLVKRYPNAVLDISGRGPNTWGMLRYGIDMAGADKILFATGFPERNPQMYIGGVLFENLTDAERTALFSGNFKRLTGEL